MHPYLVAAAAGLGVYALWSRRSAASGTPPTPNLPDSITQLSSSQTELDRIAGDITSDENDMFWLGDYPDALFMRQLWVPASRVRISDLTGEDYAQAAQFLGLVSGVRWSKGGAGGCAPSRFKKGITEKNASLESAAVGLQTTGEILNLVASIWGIKTQGIDQSIGFGRGAAELRKQKINAVNIGGVADDLRKVLSYDTALSRPELNGKYYEGRNYGDKGDAMWYLPDVTGIVPPFAEWQRPGGIFVDNGAARGYIPTIKNVGQSNDVVYAFIQKHKDKFYSDDYALIRSKLLILQKNGQKRLLSSDNRGAPMGVEMQGSVNAKPVCTYHCRVARENPGPYFRGGLFAIQMADGSSAVSNSDPFKLSEFLYPWYSYELGCATQGMKDRTYRRARLYRVLDLIATQLYPAPPNVDGLYYYRTKEGIDIVGSIFPPHPDDYASGSGPLTIPKIEVGKPLADWPKWSGDVLGLTVAGADGVVTGVSGGSAVLGKDETDGKRYAPAPAATGSVAGPPIAAADKSLGAGAKAIAAGKIRAGIIKVAND